MKINKSARQAQRGFTLIELMVSIMIIGILIAIALPNFVGAVNQAKEANVKVNMHAFQTVSETYAVDWYGAYAPNVVGLRYEATQIGKEYWKEFINPFTGLSGNGQAYNNASLVTITSTGVATPDPDNAGRVLYEVAGPTDSQYYIYGLDKSGNTITDQGQNLVLSNG